MQSEDWNHLIAVLFVVLFYAIKFSIKRWFNQ